MRALTFAVALAAFAAPALADRLSGQSVAGMMSDGPWRFQAGSVARFEGDGTFSFRHANGAQAGTFRVFADGTVELRDGQNGRTSRFYVDRTAGRPDTVVYLSGPYKGQSFALR